MLGTAISCVLLSGCTTVTTNLSRKYEVVAYKPKNPNAVRVKVSLQNRMVYVLEGERRSPMWRERNQKQVPTRCGPLGALWKLTRGRGGGW